MPGWWESMLGWWASKLHMHAQPHEPQCMRKKSNFASKHTLHNTYLGWWESMLGWLGSMPGLWGSTPG